MKVYYLNNRIKEFYKVINASIIFFGILWFFIFLFLLFKNSYLVEIASYLMALSFPIGIIGGISAIILVLIEKPFIEIDLQKSIKLTLNINEFDYKVDQLRLLSDGGNFIIDPNLNMGYEISNEQVKELLSSEHAINFDLEFKIQKSNGLGLDDMSPKKMFKSTMMFLWSSSN